MEREAHVCGMANQRKSLMKLKKTELSLTLGSASAAKAFLSVARDWKGPPFKSLAADKKALANDGVAWITFFSFLLAF